MIDDYTYEWLVGAPIERVAAHAEQCCLAQGLAGVWYSSAPGGTPVKGCRITGADGATLAVLTLQSRAADETQLQLQPAARAGDPAAVVALAGELYAALRGAGALRGAPEGPAPHQIGPHA
jgi:hypothetical protein